MTPHTQNSQAPLHGFIELSWSRQELSPDVLRHHFPCHEYLLRLTDRLELMFFFRLLRVLASLGPPWCGLQRHGWVI